MEAEEERFMNQKETIWRGDFLVFLLISLLYYINNYMLNPIIAGYSESLGGSGQMIGLISGAMSAVALFFTPVSGPLADRLDRKKLAVFSFCLLLLANVGYTMAGNVCILFACRVIQGFGFSFSSVILSTVVSTMFDSAYVGKALSIYTMVQAVGQALGPSVGLMARDSLGYRLTFGIDVALMAVCLALILFSRNFGAKPVRKGPFRISLDSIFLVRLLPVAVTCFVCGLVLHAIQSYLDPFAALTGHTAGVNVFFTVYAGALLVSRAALTRWMDRLSLGTFVLFCVPLTVLGLVTVQFQASWPVLQLGAVLCAVGIGSMQTISQVFLVKNAGADQRGVANSTYYMGMNLGHTLGGYLGGVWIAGSGAQWFFLYFIVFAVLPLLCALAFRRMYFSVKKAA